MKLPLSRSSGFTFIEILVVTILIGILTMIIVVSYQGASQSTRDARRKRDLANIQAALEVYKLNRGQYPASVGCSGSWTYPGCNAWMDELHPDYLTTLPEDPRQNAAQFIGNTAASTELYSYNYTRLTTTSYLLLTRLENENDSSINGANYSAQGVTGENMYVVNEPR